MKKKRALPFVHLQCISQLRFKCPLRISGRPLTDYVQVARPYSAICSRLVGSAHQTVFLVGLKQAYSTIHSKFGANARSVTLARCTVVQSVLLINCRVQFKASH